MRRFQPNDSLSGLLPVFLSERVSNRDTLRAYRRVLRHAIQQMDVASPREITLEKLLSFRNDLMGDSRGRASHEQTLAGLRSFLAWCVDEGLLPFDAEDVLRVLEKPLRPHQPRVPPAWATSLTLDAQRRIMLPDLPGFEPGAILLLVPVDGGGYHLSSAKAPPSTRRNAGRRVHFRRAEQSVAVCGMRSSRLSSVLEEVDCGLCKSIEGATERLRRP